MERLKEDLKSGQLNQVYLLCGEEAYLKKYYKNELRKALVSPDDTMNYAYYEGKGIAVFRHCRCCYVNRCTPSYAVIVAVSAKHPATVY